MLTFQLGQNPIGAEGATALLDAIHTHNSTTALTLLDLAVRYIDLMKQVYVMLELYMTSTD